MPDFIAHLRHHPAERARAARTFTFCSRSALWSPIADTTAPASGRAPPADQVRDGQQRAEAVAVGEQRHAGPPLPAALQQRVEVLERRREARVPARARAVPVAAEVDRADREARVREPPGQPLVAPAMLAEPVQQRDDRARLLRRLPFATGTARPSDRERARARRPLRIRPRRAARAAAPARGSSPGSARAATSPPPTRTSPRTRSPAAPRRARAPRPGAARSVLSPPPRAPS